MPHFTATCGWLPGVPMRHAGLSAGRRWCHLRLLSCAAVTASIGACEIGEREAWVETFVRFDSAGVPIFRSPGAEAFAPMSWALDSLPDLVLGVEEHPSGPFMRVVGVRDLPQGEILVVDDGRREVLLYDSLGHELARRGGFGRGPGEFRALRVVPSSNRDSIILYDIGSARATVFSSDLADMRVENLGADRLGRVAPVGVVAGLWLREHRTFNGGTFESTADTPGPVEDATTLFVTRGQSLDVHELVTFTGVRLFVKDDAPMNLVPHAPAPAWTPISTGLLVTDGARFEVRELDPDGGLTRILRIQGSTDPVTSEMIEGWARRMRETPPGIDVEPRYVKEYDGYPIPSHLPAFRSLLLDSEGWVWAEIYGWDPHEPVRWALFDPDGRARGVMRMPAGFELRSVGANRLLGVWRTDFGEEFVHSYRLRRSGASRAARSLLRPGASRPGAASLPGRHRSALLAGGPPGRPAPPATDGGNGHWGADGTPGAPG